MRKPMAHINQRGENDCGLAVAAMVLGMSYRETRERYYEWMKWPTRRMMEGIHVETMNEFLTHVTEDEREILVIENVKVKDFEPRTPDRTPVLVWRCAGFYGHWVAWHCGVIYDPAEHDPVAPKWSLRAEFFAIRALCLRLTSTGAD